MPAFDYTSRDYTNIKADLLARAGQVAPDWSTRDPSDFGMVMLDMWSQMGDVLHYYVDRAAGEAFLPTATQRESVLSYASLLGYLPYGRTSAEGTVTIANSSSSDVTLPAYTSFTARDGDSLYYFYTSGSSVIPAGSTGTSITVYEGRYVEDEVLTSSATGTVGQKYTLVYDKVVPSSVTVNVYETPGTPTRYFRVENLLDALPGSKVFRTKSDPNEFTEVVFGGNNFGSVPQSGVTVTASYAYSSGSRGNLVANSIFAFTSSISGVSGLSIVSSSAMYGGQDAEPISVLRQRIPTAFGPQGRAVTLDDYVNIARGISSVAKVTATYAAASAGSNASVTVYPQTDRSSDFLTTSDTSQTVSTSTSDAVLATLTPRKMLGVDVICAGTIDWQPIYIGVTLYVENTSYASEVKDRVEERIRSQFGFNNVGFGQAIDLGLLYRTILGVRGLNYAIVTEFNTDGLGSVQDVIEVDALKLPRIIMGTASSDTVTLTTSGGITL